MFDFIPLEYYTPLYFNMLLLVVIITFIHTQSYSGFSKITFTFNKVTTSILFSFVLLYIGLRPISFVFGDMGTYASHFDQLAYGDGFLFPKGDIGFYSLMKLISYTKSATLFFFIIAVLYVVPLYIAVRKWFPTYYFFGFLMLLASFSFWSFGTNGLRNGVATSFMLLAFSLKNKPIKYGLFLLALSFHSSVLLIIGAYFLSVFVENSKIYFYSWLASIFLSLSMGSIWGMFFLKLVLGKENKLYNYLSGKGLVGDSTMNVGFRWDFLIYSTSAVAVAYYFIMIKKINDKHYQQLVHIYLTVNAIWIFVIRARFSNRFAYLSWFLMGIIIIYPFLKEVYWKNQFAIVGYVIAIYFSFTYFMNIFIY